MQIKLKSISEYRKEYKVYALFEGADRRFADIVRSGYEEASIDSYIIMINPGSCHKKSDENPVIDTAFYKGFNMVEAVSDPAQKCIMALMEILLKLLSIKVLVFLMIAGLRTGKDICLQMLYV